MTRQISHKIETYQMERLIQEGTISHHAINVLSKGSSHFELEESEGGYEINGESGREDEGKEQRKHPWLNTGESTTSHDHQVIQPSTLIHYSGTPSTLTTNSGNP